MNVKRLLSLRPFLYVAYLPRIVRLISNWAAFLLFYLGLRQGPCSVNFRGGTRICGINEAVTGTIAVVFVRRHYGRLSACNTIVDIGANVGVFSLYAALECPDARLYCYEPVRSNFNTLCENIKTNGYSDRIKAINFGVAAHPGPRRIYLTSSQTHSFVQSAISEETEIIQCTTLTDLINDNHIECVDFLKMNCEGAEYEILEAGVDALRFVRNIRMEYHNLECNECQAGNLCSYLCSAGFTIERLKEYSKADGFIWAKNCGRQKRAFR